MAVSRWCRLFLPVLILLLAPVISDGRGPRVTRVVLEVTDDGGLDVGGTLAEETTEASTTGQAEDTPDPGGGTDGTDEAPSNTSAVIPDLENEVDEAARYHAYLGSTLNALHHFGLLYTTVKVLPSHLDYEPFFRGARRRLTPIIEPLKTVFHEHSIDTHARDDPELRGEVSVRLYACHTIRELLDSYFDDMQIEGIIEPWRAFYSPTAKNMGLARRFRLDPEYFSTDGEYRFVLVKVSRVSGVYHLNTTQAEFLDHYLNETSRWEEDNTVPCLDSVEQYGSHVISEVTIGDVLCQVFVFTPDYFKMVLERIPLGRSVIEDLGVLSDVLTPWYVEKFGDLALASGDMESLESLEDILWDYTFLGVYTNVLRIRERRALEHFLGTEGGVVIGMQLQTIFHYLPSSAEAGHCEAALRNSLRLWEANTR